MTMNPLDIYNVQSRRSFLAHCSTSLLSIAGASLFPSASHASVSPNPVNEAQLEKWRIGHSLLLPETLQNNNLKVKGRIPDALYGTFYRTGTASFKGYQRTHNHWFDGDGFLHKFVIQDGRVSHYGRFLQTQKYKLERAKGRLFMPAFSKLYPESPIASNPDEMNTANTNVIQHAGRLLALWEGGSAHEVKEQDFSKINTVTWDDSLKFMPFSAHPKQDSEGNLWNIGYVPWARSFVLYHINAKGNLEKYRAIRFEKTGMTHDFAITDRHLLMIIPPLYWKDGGDLNKAAFLQNHYWNGDAPMRLKIFSKESFELVRELDLPNGFFFHTCNAWEEDNGTIHLDLCAYDDGGVVWRFPFVMPNQNDGVLPPTGRHTSYQISPSGSVTTEGMGDLFKEFPVIAPTLVGKRSRKRWFVSFRENYPVLNRLVYFDMDTGDEQHYDYGDDYIAEEHLFIPANQMAGVEYGWLIGTALNVTTQRTHMSLFVADRLPDGPIASVELPYGIPLSFHGEFVRDF